MPAAGEDLEPLVEGGLLGKIVVCGFALALALFFALIFCPLNFALSDGHDFFLLPSVVPSSTFLPCVSFVAFSFVVLCLLKIRLYIFVCPKF